MAGRSVDLVAAAPPPEDPYDVGSAPWALAAAFAAEGDRVQVLYPAQTTDSAPPSGVVAVPIPVPLRRPGALVEAADFAASAGRRVSADAELVVRDPSGLGSLGLGRRRPFVVAFVRSVSLHAFDAESLERPAGSFVDRLDAWRDRRAVRRLERVALEEADALYCDRPDLADSLTREYGVPAGRLQPSVPPVPLLPSTHGRDEARKALGIPPDVPVAVAAAPEPQAEPSGLDTAREAFRRVRAFFPGARLVIVGAPSPSEPGVLVAPSRDAGAFGAAFAAADVAVFARRAPGFDPGVIFAIRGGAVPVVVPAVRLPAEPGGAVRPTASDDPGDLASELAELFADPALRRGIRDRGRGYADRFDPGAIARSLRPRAVPAA